MAQNIWSSLDPFSVSGVQLASFLNDFKDAAVSGFSGTSRPTNLDTYGYWVDTTNIGSSKVDFKFYDGTSDITLFTVNLSSGGIEFGSTEGSFEILKATDDSIGPKLLLEKARVAGGGQTLTDDIVGDIDFKSNDGSAVDYVVARIRSLSKDDVTSSEQGADITFYGTPTDGNTLTEIMRLLGEKKVGVGIASPEKQHHIYSTDATAGYKSTIAIDSANGPTNVLNKRRSTGNGQVLDNDVIGTQSFTSTDQNGDEIEVAKIVATANENHTDTNQGTDFSIQVKDNGGASFTEVMKFAEGVLTLNGVEQADGSSTLDMAHGGVAQDLLTVDGTLYGAFVAEIMATGRDGTESRQQATSIRGVYDFNNTTWEYSYSDDILNGADNLFELAFTNAATLDIDYNCQLVQGTFNDGKLYIKIRRFPR